MSEPTNTQTVRKLSLQETMKPQTPFIGNKTTRVASGALIGLLFIFILGSMLTSAVVLWKLFWDGKNPGSSYGILMESNPEHKEWKRALESSLGLCGAVILVIVILLILYFLFLETDFMFSERLSRNLSIATQGPDRLRQVAGLLTNYVYPPGSVPDSVRASLANQFIMRLRQAYDTQNQITRLSPEDYENIEKIRKTTGFTPGTQNLTSQEYQLINQLATQKATEIANGEKRTVTPGDIRNQFNTLKDQAQNVIGAAHNEDMLRTVGAPTQAQRTNYIYGAAGMDTPEVAREKAAAAAAAEQQKAAIQAEKEKQLAANKAYAKQAQGIAKAHDYSKAQLEKATEARDSALKEEATSRANLENWAVDKRNGTKYKNAVAEHAVLQENSKSAREDWETAKALHAKNTAAYTPYLSGAVAEPYPDVKA